MGIRKLLSDFDGTTTSRNPSKGANKCSGQVSRQIFAGLALAVAVDAADVDAVGGMAAAAAAAAAAALAAAKQLHF